MFSCCCLVGLKKNYLQHHCRGLAKVLQNHFHFVARSPGVLALFFIRHCRLLHLKFCSPKYVQNLLGLANQSWIFRRLLEKKPPSLGATSITSMMAFIITSAHSERGHGILNAFFTNEDAEDERLSTQWMALCTLPSTLVMICALMHIIRTKWLLEGPFYSGVPRWSMPRSSKF